jgi:ubiquinone/menaquinone biosynthesis C-methylase UbiE
MPKITAFDRYPEVYDRWFDEHPHTYQAEVQALERFVPWKGFGLEVGVGTARFAAPLHIEVGIDPSPNMALIARERGVSVAIGVAEDLPFCDGSFDFVTMVTAICFFDDISDAFAEAFRVARSGAPLIIGMIDRDGLLGRQYQADKDKSLFFSHARFYTVPEVINRLEEEGFQRHEVVQTVFLDLCPGPSGFVVVSAYKKG